MADVLQLNVSKAFTSIGDLATDERKSESGGAKSILASVLRGMGDGIDKMPQAFPWLKFMILVFEFLGKLAKLLGEAKEDGGG